MAVEQSLDYEAVVDFAERFVRRWNAHDVEGILALVSEDVIWDDPVMEGRPTAALRRSSTSPRSFGPSPTSSGRCPAPSTSPPATARATRS